MVIDATFLGPRSSFAPGNFGSIANSSRSVSLPLILSAIRYLTWLLNSDTPLWKQLITQGLATDECVSIITAIFSDDGRITMVRNLQSDDAQSFIDAIDRVIPTLRVPRIVLLTLT